MQYPILLSLLETLKPKATILDYGSFGWTVYHLATTHGLTFKHHAADLQPPKNIPSDVQFHLITPGNIPHNFPDDGFDLVVASHVLEHVHDPLPLFQELARITKPGGRIYIEAPSDRSVLLKSDPDVESHSFFSFWDDPTHLIVKPNNFHTYLTY